jgi:hypothetical protein
MLIADCVGYLATSPRCRLVLGCPIPALWARSSFVDSRRRARSVLCSCITRARSGVPGLGGLIARLSTRRAGTIERAPTGVNTGHGPVGSGSRRRPGRRRLTGPALKPTERRARLRAASSKLRWS